MKQYIIFDCDDVLCDTASALKQGIEEILNREVIDTSKWNTWHLEELFPDLSWKLLKEWIQDNKILQTIEPYPNARKIIETAKRKNYRTVILTARGYLSNGKQITEKWVKDNNLPIDTIFCTPPSLNKSDFIATLPRRCKFYIDDHHDHIVRCERKNTVETPILFDRPWNLKASVSNRVKTLEDFLSFL